MPFATQRRKEISTTVGPSRHRNGVSTCVVCLVARFARDVRRRDCHSPRLWSGVWTFLLVSNRLGLSLGTSKAWTMLPCYCTVFSPCSPGGDPCSGQSGAF